MTKQENIIRGLKEVRKHRKLTIKDVSDMLDVHENTILNLERGGQSRVNFNLVLDYCEVLGVEIGIIYRALYD